MNTYKQTVDNLIKGLSENLKPTDKNYVSVTLYGAEYMPPINCWDMLREEPRLIKVFQLYSQRIVENFYVDSLDPDQPVINIGADLK